jgi:glycosyltransferase involved in cell wall biosynthesis
MSAPRIHLLGLPNAPVNPDYSLDGFATAGHRFARMLERLGYPTILYGAEGSNAPCTEFVQIISERERVALLGDCEYQHATMDERFPLWQLSNAKAAAEISLRKQPGDFLLTIGGESQKPIFDFHPDLLPVEYSIGYEGNFCRNRVFESRAWQHYCYGWQKHRDGRFFDTTIPLFFDPDQFPFWAEPEDYFLYVGRLTERKGVHVACQIAKAAGVKMKFIGHGDKNLITGGHEYLGAVDWKTRNEVMSKARAVICPTLYMEPFNAVSVEAQLCGTPVIATDWGGFTETIEHGETGFRCAYLGKFVNAVRAVDSLDRLYIRDRAIRNYSMWNLCEDYAIYFYRLQKLFGDGWNSLDTSLINSILPPCTALK